MFDYPNAPVSGDQITMPDGTVRVWDGVKWTAGSNAVVAAGSSEPRTLPERFSDVVNVKDYGAKGDTKRRTDGVITAGTSSLTSASAAFVSTDVGKSILVHGVGAGGASMQGTITAVNSSTNVTVSFTTTLAAPWFGVSSASVAAGGSGYAVGNVLTVVGGVGTAATLTVASVSTGAVTSVTMTTPGNYTSIPTNPVSVSGGAGTGATLTLSTSRAGGIFVFGTDDTVSVTDAFGMGQATYFPNGAYWLATQTAPISVSAQAVMGDGPTENVTNVVSAGSQLLISNKSTAAFTLSRGTSWYGLSFFWPEQDGAMATPIAFPALWEGGQFGQFTLDGITVINAYTMIHALGNIGSAFGRTLIRGLRAYAISCVFDIDGGLADILQIDSATYFTIGAGFTPDPFNILYDYTQRNGSVFSIDIGSAAYTSVDGLGIVGTFAHGYRYGFRVISGTLSYMTLTGTRWECATVISSTGTSKVLGANINGGYIWSQGPDLDQHAPVFEIAGAAGELTFGGGLLVNYALGEILSIASGGSVALHVSGVNWQNWGLSTTTGPYAAISVNSTGPVVVAGSQFKSVTPPAGTTLFGVQVFGAESSVISGCDFKNTYNPVRVLAGSGNHIVNGCTSTSTGAAQSLYDGTSGTGVLYDFSNKWDKRSLTHHVGANTTYHYGITAFAGGGATNATLLDAYHCVITTVATAGDSVKLPLGVPGMSIKISNPSTNSCTIFGSGSDLINNTSSVTLANGKTGMWSCPAAGVWYGGSLA